MNLDRFTTLLEAYGANPERWPADERAAAEQLLADSAQAQTLRAAQAPLDEALDHYDVDPDMAQLRAGIMARINTPATAKASPGLIDNIIRWLIPEPGNISALWRPALVATVPLALGIILGSTISISTLDTTASWDDEITLVALDATDSESLP